MAAAEMDEEKLALMEFFQISSSQEEILLNCPFVDPNDGAPLSSGEIPVASTGIAIVSLPETVQDTARDRGSQDVFQTPPEQQSSQSASEGHSGAIHKAVETDDETQDFFNFSEYAEAAEYVDLSDDSELGLSQGILNQGTELTLVAEECLDGNDFVDTMGEKNLGSCENLGRTVAQSKIAKSANEFVENVDSKEGNCKSEKRTDEGNKTVNEIAENFERQRGEGDEQPESSVLPSTGRDILKNIAQIKKGIESGNNFVFDVFGALPKDNSVEDNSLENVCWLELANSRGFNFPRPYWWKNNDNQKN